MSIHPSDGFEDWNSFFIGMLEQGGEYSSFLDDAISLIHQIINFNQLFAPNTEFTNVFISQTLPDVFNKILSFKNPGQIETGRIVTFLKKSQVMIPWICMQDKVELFDSYSKLTDPQMPFYQYIFRKKEFQEITEYFINHEFLTLISLRIQNKTKPVSFDHFNYFFKVMLDHPRIPESVQFMMIYNTGRVYSHLLKSIDAANSIESSQLITSLQYFLKIASVVYSDNVKSILLDYLNLILTLFNQESYEKQNLGATLLKLFTDSTDVNIKTIFYDFLSDNNFICDLIQKDLHPNILQNVTPLIKSFITRLKLSSDKLIPIFKASTVVNQDQKQLLFEIISGIASKFYYDDFVKFYQDISPHSLSSKGISEIDFIQFLVVTLLQNRDMDRRKSNAIIQLIIENSVLCKDQAKAFQTIQPLCDKSVSLHFRLNLFTECQKSLQKNYSLSLVLIQIEFTKDSAFCKSKQYDENFLKVIENHLLANNDIENLCDLYAKLLLIHHKQINHEVFKKILNEPTNNLWIFLLTLIENNALTVFNDDSYSLLNKFINQYQQFDSMDFFSFLQNYIVLVNLKEKRIKQESHDYIVIKMPLEFEQIIINFMFSRNQTIYKESQSLLLKLTKYSEPTNLAIEHIIGIVLKDISDSNQPIYKSRVKLYRYFRFFYDYIKCCKKDSLHVFSHQFSITESTIGYSEFNVSILNEDNQFQIKMQSGISISFLLCQISSNLKYNLNQYTILIDNKDINDIKTIPYGKHSITVEYNKNNVEKSLDPCDCFLHKGIVRLIYDYLLKPELPPSPKMPEDSASIHQLNQKFHHILSELLQELPTESSLQLMSSDPIQFLNEIKKNENKDQVQYLLQILIWRLKSAKYLNMYAKDNILLNMIIEKFKINSDSLSQSVSEFIDIMERLNCFYNQESLLPILYFLTMQSINDDTKNVLLSNLLKNKSDITAVFASEPELLGDVIENINEEMFFKLKQIIFKTKNMNLIYEMTLSRTKKPATKNVQFFVEIVAFILPKIQSMDIEKQIQACLEIIQMPSISNNVSIKIISEMTTLLQNNHAKFIDSSQLMKTIFGLIQSNLDQNIQKGLFSINSLLSCFSKENRNELNSFLTNLSLLKPDKFSISLEANQMNEKKQKGLKNLGATCYMNSVLQQFVNIPGFCVLLAQIKPESNNSFYLLQKLFCSLLYTKRPYSDPSQFFEIWSSTHTHATVSEQQDAQEFMQYFLDDLPKHLTKLYTGTITNFIESEDHTFTTQIDESFISLPISIEKFTSVIDSLASIQTKQRLFGNNQYTTKEGKKINAENYQMIKQSPPILIIQLNRFRFNQATKMREKINTRFEIADTLDISSILLNKDKNFSKYTLHGVIVHRGNGDHGHYISYIKKNANAWYRFDDTDVTEVNQKTYEDEAFGLNEPKKTQYGTEPNNMNGYLLFYIADKASIKINNKAVPLLGESQIEFSIGIQRYIDRDNKSFVADESVFTIPTFDFILEEASNEQFLNFYFNVFCHSTAKTDLIGKYESKIDLLFFKDEENQKLLIDWFLSNFSTVIYVLANITNEKIAQLLNSFIIKTISINETEKNGQLVNSFIEFLLNCQNAWREVSNISKFIYTFIKLNSNNAKYAIDHQWSNKLLKIVFDTYNGERLDYFIQNVDISPIFDSIDILIQKDLKELYLPLVNIASQVQKSPSAQNYKKLIVDLASAEIIPIELALEKFPNALNRNKIIEIKFNQSSNLDSIRKDLKKLSISNDDIITFLSNNLTKFSSDLIDKYNFEFLFDLFMHDSIKIEKILVSILDMDKGKPKDLFDFLRSKMEQVSRSTSRNTIMAFLRIVFLLMKKIDFPRSMKLDELRFFRNYEHTIEFEQISSYLGNTYILTKYDEQFQKKIFYYPQENDFINMIAVIEVSSNEVIDQFLHKPNLPEVLKDYISKMPNANLDDIEKFIRFLLEYQARNHNDESLISHLVFCCLISNITKDYCVRLAEYFSKVFQFLTSDEIASSFKIIDSLMSLKSDEIIDRALSFYIAPIFSYLESRQISFTPSTIKKFELNPINILNYISSGTQLGADFLIKFVSQIASLNVHFRKSSREVFQNPLRYQAKADLHYISAALLSEYCLIDSSSKNDNDISKELSSIYRDVCSVENMEWRNFLFKYYYRSVKSEVEIPLWAKLFVESIFHLSSLSCGYENDFFRAVIQSYSPKESVHFLYHYSTKFDSDCYRASHRANDQNLPIRQLDQLVFLLTLFSKEDIEQNIEIKHDWFKNPRYQSYQSKILK